MENLAAIQWIEVWLPTTDGRWLILPRYTQSEKVQQMLLKKLRMNLLEQPLRIRTEVPATPPPARHFVAET